MKRFTQTLLASLLLACGGSGKTTTPIAADPTSEPGTPAPTEGTPLAESDGPAPPPAGKQVVKTTLENVGLSNEALDRGADPCEDFYQFACGGWMAKNEIPADKSRWGRFHEINDRIENALKGILEEAAKLPAGDKTPKARLGAYYAACMDEGTAEKNGVKPLKPLMDKIGKVRDGKTLLGAVVDLHKAGVDVMFVLGADQDAKDTTRVVGQLVQGGLGLPDRDYYTSDDEHMKKLREAYQAHVEKLFVLAGDKPEAAKSQAVDVMAIEGAIATVSMTTVERRDPEKVYNKVARAELAKTAPGFDWDAYLKGMGVKGDSDLILMSIPYFKAVAELSTSIPADKWRTYLRARTLHTYADHLTKAFVDEDFAWTQALTGQAKMEDRWKRCVKQTSFALAEDLGQEFVQVMFAGDSKRAAQEMVAAISDAFNEELGQLTWMDEDTRERAREKLKTLAYHIGYPNKWKQYTFKADRKTFVANAIAASKWRSDWELARIGKPVDREEWIYPPQVVNAYYNPTKNEMVFLAGILQPPFFSAKAGVAVNLGAIGMVIGHELIHGYDDEGSQFGPDGNLKKWWSDDARSKFEKQTQCVEKQFSKYETLPGVKLDGKLTLGENLADLGGVSLAFRAYHRLRDPAPETIVADGFTEDQQFFLGVGQIWCINQREAIARQLAKTDPHSPGRFRVTGPLTNLPEFHKAFGCRVGQKMRPPAGELCKVW